MAIRFYSPTSISEFQLLSVLVSVFIIFLYCSHSNGYYYRPHCVLLNLYIEALTAPPNPALRALEEGAFGRLDEVMRVRPCYRWI